MLAYEEKVFKAYTTWKEQMLHPPSKVESFTKNVQDKLNRLIPGKAHELITITIEKMVKAVLFSSTYLTFSRKKEGSLQFREAYVKRTIKHYRNAATLEGTVTGAGGFLMGLADFPAFLAIKMKLLFEISAIYGHDIKDYRERLFILHVFQISFCSQKRRNQLIAIIENWPSYINTLPNEVEKFDWLKFQQEYRDYIDLAKMAQLIPVIGALVGAIANYRLTHQLGTIAMNCYRSRYFHAYQGNA